MIDLIRKIEIHLETTEECIENTSMPQYVVELLEADNKLFNEVITKYQQERSYSEEDLEEAFKSGFTNCYNHNNTTFGEWFEQFKKKNYE